MPLIPDETTLAHMERQLASLTRRIWRIEQHLGLKESAELPLEHQPIPRGPDPDLQRKLDRNLGETWSLRVGAIAIIFAIGFFLAYAWPLLSPMERLGCGFLAGTVFLYFGLGSGDRLGTRYAQVLLMTGLVIYYLTFWAGSSHYQLLSPKLSWAGMDLIAIVGTWMAFRTRARGFFTLSFLGAACAPFLADADPSLMFLFSHFAILDAIVLLIAALKGWPETAWFSFVLTLIFVAGRAMTSYSDTQRWIYFGFLSFYFLLYFGFGAKRTDRLLILFSLLGYAASGYELLEPVMGKCLPLFPLSLSLLVASCYRIIPAAFSMSLSLLLLLGALTQATYQWDAPKMISLVWTAFSTLLLLVGMIKKQLALRLFAFFLMGLTLFKVFFVDLNFLDAPYRILSFGVLGLALIGISALYQRTKEQT